MASGYVNTMPLLSEEDVLGASCINAKLKSIMSINCEDGWHAGNKEIGELGPKPRCYKDKHYEMTNTAPFAHLIL